jgi:putative peptidoglycan lipid II flippase
MASGTVVSRILGLVRTVLLAYAIGITTFAADAFGVANQLPNNVYAIVVGGLLNAVLVPQIVRARVRKDGGQGYIDGLLTIIILVFAAITVLATVLAPVLVRIYTTGWDENTLALATAFAYWCLPQLFFYGLYSILGEVLNARSSFGPFMWAPVLNNLVAIAGLIAFIAWFGAGRADSLDWSQPEPIALLAGTATAGVAAQALILLFFWKRIGLRFTFNFKWRGLGLRPALKAASWTLAMLVITQIGGLVQTNLASSTLAARNSVGGEGVMVGIASVAVAATAWLIFMIPHSIGTVSIATAYFTRMSEHASERNWAELKKDLNKALRLIILISTFAAIIMAVLSYPIGRVFALQYDPAAALGLVLVAMMIGLVPFSINFMLQRVFYALEDTKSPFVFTTIQILVFIVGAYVAAALVPAAALVAAISLVMSFSFTVQAIIAWLMLRKRIGQLSDGKLFSDSAKIVVASTLSGAAGAAVLWALGGVSESSFAMQGVVDALVSSALVGLAAGITYLAALLALGNEEVRSALTGIRRR